MFAKKEERRNENERKRKKGRRKKIHPYECLKRKVWKNMTCVT